VRCPRCGEEVDSMVRHRCPIKIAVLLPEADRRRIDEIRRESYELAVRRGHVRRFRA
jgi:hypothetical protein